MVATATETGRLVIPSNSVTNIDTPIFGWDSVTNVNAGDEGESEETDVQLRARRQSSVGIAATSVYDALKASIDSKTNVKYSRVYENDTRSSDPVTGQPPYTFQCVVDGGFRF